MRRVFPVLLAGAVAAAALVVGGCGASTEVSPTAETVVGAVAEPAAPDPDAGRTVFLEAGCGACHVLAHAGTNGIIGPSLDQSMPSLKLIVDRVTNGKGQMPAFGDQLTQPQIADVAAYVAGATQG